MISCLFLMTMGLIRGEHAENDTECICGLIMYLVGMVGVSIFYYRLLNRIEKLEKQTKQN